MIIYRICNKKLMCKIFQMEKILKMVQTQVSSLLVTKIFPITVLLAPLASLQRISNKVWKTCKIGYLAKA